MLNIFKILMVSLALSAMLTVTSVAQPINLATDEVAMLQKDKQKERERPVEREKKDDRRDDRRDEKKDDKRKKPDEQS
jgi:Ni/Co efflux regulator RcnB